MLMDSRYYLKAVHAKSTNRSSSSGMNAFKRLSHYREPQSTLAKLLPPPLYIINELSIWTLVRLQASLRLTRSQLSLTCVCLSYSHFTPSQVYRPNKPATAKWNLFFVLFYSAFLVCLSHFFPTGLVQGS